MNTSVYVTTIDLLRPKEGEDCPRIIPPGASSETELILDLLLMLPIHKIYPKFRWKPGMSLEVYYVNL